MEIISKKKAIEIGQKWFFTGKPCKNGHIEKRMVCNHRCYQCSRDAKKKAREINGDKIRRQGRESYRRNFETIAKKAKDKYIETKEERQKYLKEYYKKNKEKLLEKQKEYYKNNKQKIRKYKKKYNSENKEKISKYFKELWKNSDRKIAKQISANKRVALKKSTGDNTVTKKFIFSLKAKQKNRCIYCEANIEEKFHIDHIVALSKGGTHTSDNIQLLCGTCNLKKSNKDHIEYAMEQGRLL